MKKRIAQRCGAAGFALMLATTMNANAQTSAPVTKLPWSTMLSPVVLGSALEVQPGNIEVLNQSVDPTSFKWQNKTTTFAKMDYSNLTNTINSLNLNAWAEYQGFFSSGSFSVDFSQYQAFQGNHRHWEIDALRDWTAFIPKPTLNALAQTYLNNPAAFQNLFGDYAVTGIAYRRQIQICFDAVFTSNMTSSQMNTAISASFGPFNGGGSVSAAQTALNQFAQVTITVTVIGQQGGTLLAAGSTGDLAALSQAVTNQLSTWDAVPTDPNNAGNVSTVYVTPYTAIPPIMPIAPLPGPDQVKLVNAIAEYVNVKNGFERLGEIKTQDTNLNPQLTTYLFGKTDSQGNHIPGTGKLDEATADLGRQYAYMQSLANADGKVPDPKINFKFDDPDVVRWRVLDAIYINSTGDVTRDPCLLNIEVYSNARVTPLVANYSPTVQWEEALHPYNQAGQLWNLLDTACPGTYTYTANLDAVTGILHRYVSLFFYTNRGPLDTSIPLINDGGVSFYNATDWAGWPTPSLFVPGGEFREKSYAPWGF